MGLIKSISAPAEITPFSIRDIEIQAQSVLLRARKGAELLLIEAQKEAESLKALAHGEGFSAGHAEGLDKGTEDGRKTGHQAALLETKTQLTQAWAALTAAVGQIEAARHEMENGALTEVVRLADGIARRVTKRQSMLEPEVLIDNLRDAMKLVVQASDVRIVLNPAQRKTLTDELPKLQLHWPNLKHVELIDDPAVAVGGCRIITRHGELDARIDQQLDRVINDLLPTADAAQI